MIAAGAPLIEPIPGDTDHMLVTFLWRAAQPLRNVVVVGGLAGRGFDRMAFMEGSDLWYKTYRARADTHTLYHLTPNDSLLPYDQEPDWEARTAAWRPDPLNPRIFTHWGADGASELILPAAPSNPWVVPQPGVACGRVEAHRFHSPTFEAERDVWVYTPPAYDTAGEPYRLLLLFDGWDYLASVPAPTILDNLTAERRIPPFVALLIGSPDRFRELACYAPLNTMLVDELLPWVRQRYHVSADPGATIIGGSSFGGLAAAFAGLRHPQAFGAVLALSSSFHWKPDADGEYEWLARQFAASPRLPVRFYLAVGNLEDINLVMKGPDFIQSSRHMRDVLQAKGYTVSYAEFSGGHDPINWRYSLADGLIALAGRY
jgi:enterochelin esterase family protein